MPLKATQQMRGMPLHDHDGDEENRHDDAAHGGGSTAVQPFKSHLAEDGDEGGRKCGEESIEKPRGHE